MSSATTTDCDHLNARITETEESDDGWFYEEYRCACGARGRIEGYSGKPAHTWNRTGEVFRDA